MPSSWFPVEGKIMQKFFTKAASDESGDLVHISWEEAKTIRPKKEVDYFTSFSKLRLIRLVSRSLQLLSR